MIELRKRMRSQGRGSQKPSWRRQAGPWDGLANSRQSEDEQEAAEKREVHSSVKVGPGHWRALGDSDHTSLARPECAHWGVLRSLRGLCNARQRSWSWHYKQSSQFNSVIWHYEDENIIKSIKSPIPPASQITTYPFLRPIQAILSVWHPASFHLLWLAILSHFHTEIYFIFKRCPHNITLYECTITYFLP